MKLRPLSPEEHPKGSGLYRARRRIGGKMKTICSGVPLGEALESIRAFELLHADVAVREGMTLEAFGVGFLERREKRGVRGVGQERARWKLMINRDPIGSLVIRTLNRADMLDWLARWAGKGKQTRKNALNLLRSALDECVDRGLCERNVAREVKVERAGRASQFDELGGKGCDGTFRGIDQRVADYQATLTRIQ